MYLKSKVIELMVLVARSLMNNKGLKQFVENLDEELKNYLI